MNVASIGPHVVVPQKDEAQIQVLDYSKSTAEVVPPSETSAEPSMTEDNGKSRFSKIYDLLQEAEKKRAKNGNKRKMRALRIYQSMKDAKPQETLGTLYVKSV